jgi:14-3-3 protein epsilon
MQLLRDNLTLWTSSDGNEGEGAGSAEPKAEEQEAAPAAEDKPEEPKAEES